jgi:hypothetical protein
MPARWRVVGREGGSLPGAQRVIARGNRGAVFLEEYIRQHGTKLRGDEFLDHDGRERTLAPRRIERGRTHIAGERGLRGRWWRWRRERRRFDGRRRGPGRIHDGEARARGVGAPGPIAHHRREADRVQQFGTQRQRSLLVHGQCVADARDERGEDGGRLRNVPAQIVSYAHAVLESAVGFDQLLPLLVALAQHRGESRSGMEGQRAEHAVAEQRFQAERRESGIERMLDNRFGGLAADAHRGRFPREQQRPVRGVGSAERERDARCKRDFVKQAEPETAAVAVGVTRTAARHAGQRAEIRRVHIEMRIAENAVPGRGLRVCLRHLRVQGRSEQRQQYCECDVL